MTVETTERSNSILGEIKTSVQHMAAYGLGNILVKAFAFLMIPFYTHYLTPRAYGILEILDLSMSLFGLVLNMGLIPAFLRCYAAAEAPGEKLRVVSSGSIFVILTGTLTFGVGAMAVRPVSAAIFGPETPPVYLLMSFASLILSYIANVPRTYLRALDAAGMYTLIDTASLLIQLVLNIVFIAGFKAGLAGILWSSLIVGGLQCALMTGWAMQKSGFWFSPAYVKQMLRFGLPLILANCGMFVLNFSDRFFLQRFQSLEVVGIYALGYKLGYMLYYLIVQPFFIMWQARMYSIQKQLEHKRIFNQIFALYALGLIYTGLAIALLSPVMVSEMVESKFAASQQVIPLVVLSYIFYGLGYYAQVGMYLTENTRMIGAIGLGCAAVNLVLNYVLIRAFGMMGAAVATVVSFAVLAVVSFWQSQRVYPLPLGTGRIGAATALAAGLYLACGLVAPVPRGLGILARGGVLVLFPVIVWRSGMLAPAAAATLLSARDRARAEIGRRLSLGRNMAGF